MNRYLIDGIIHDLANGHNIAINLPGRQAREIFKECLNKIGPIFIERSTLANGREEIRLTNNAYLKIIRTEIGLRGLTPDVLITDDSHDLETWQSIHATGAEVIRM